MADLNMTLAEFLSKPLEGSLIKAAAKAFFEAAMEMEVSDQIGAARYERSNERQTHRNGYRERELETTAGLLELRVPKLRNGTYFPSLLKPRRRAEQALVSVIQEAYVHGVSTRKVEELAQAMGLENLDKSRVSRLCSELDAVVEGFRTRPLDAQRYAYLWLDATFLKVREGGHVRSMAVVVAVAVNETGHREVLGFDVGHSEDYEFWKQFLRSLIERGLSRVELVISDAHAGLKRAIRETCASTWQRCRVHFMRNVLSQVCKSSQPIVSAAVRQIYNQTTYEDAQKVAGAVADQLKNRFPNIASKLTNEVEDTLSYMLQPAEHQRQLHSTNSLERLNREIKRRTDVVGIFPHRGSVLRLVGMILIEQDDEWMVMRGVYSQESMKKAFRGPEEVPASEAPALPGD